MMAGCEMSKTSECGPAELQYLGLALHQSALARRESTICPQVRYHREVLLKTALARYTVSL